MPHTSDIIKVKASHVDTGTLVLPRNREGRRIHSNPEGFAKLSLYPAFTNAREGPRHVWSSSPKPPSAPPKISQSLLQKSRYRIGVGGSKCQTEVKNRREQIRGFNVRHYKKKKQNRTL
jgi:hypothetical protein